MSPYTKLIAGCLMLASTAILGCSKDMPDPEEPKTKDEPTLDVPDPRPEPKSLMAGLIITSSPPVEIKIDGKSRGTTPLDLTDIEPGTHDVTFMFKGDERMTQTVTLAEGETQKLNQNVSPDSSDAIMGN